MALMVAEALRGLSFVEDMEPCHVEKLAAMAREVGFEKDQIIFREGDTGKQFYIVLTGKVALEMTTAGGVQRVLTVEGGRELGWSFMLSNRGRHFRARALGGVRALVFDGHELQEACQKDESFGYKVMKRVLQVVSDRLEATRMRFMDYQGF